MIVIYQIMFMKYLVKCMKLGFSDRFRDELNKIRSLIRYKLIIWTLIYDSDDTMSRSWDIDWESWWFVRFFNISELMISFHIQYLNFQASNDHFWTFISKSRLCVEQISYLATYHILLFEPYTIVILNSNCTRDSRVRARNFALKFLKNFSAQNQFKLYFCKEIFALSEYNIGLILRRKSFEKFK